MSTNPSISVIIVSYNVRDMLGNCLESLEHACSGVEQGVEVIVVDNHSQDGTVALLRPRYSKVRWIPLEHNTGFGSGCNRGASQARGELLVFLNPDTLVEKDTLSEMWNLFSTEKKLGIAGCRILNSDDTLQLACRRSFPTPLTAFFKFVGLAKLFPRSKVFGRYNLTYLDEFSDHEVDAVSGSFMCMRKSLFQKVGGFDTDFFMYGEDLDLCYRVQKMGFQNLYTPRTSIVHFKGQSSRSRPLRSLFHFYQAMVIFSHKHFELRPLPLALFYVAAILLGSVNFIRSSFRRWPRWLLDLVLANLIFYFSASIYASLTWGVPFYIQVPTLYIAWHTLLSVLILLFLGISGDYGRSSIQLPRSATTLGLAILAFYTVGFFFYEGNFSRISLGVTGVTTYAALVGWRFLVERGRLLHWRFLGARKRLLLVGVDERSVQFAERLQNGDVTGYEFLGLVAPISMHELSEDRLPEVIGEIDRLPSLVEQLDIQLIVVSQDVDSYHLAVRVLEALGKGGPPVRVLVGSPQSRTIQWVDLHLKD